MKRNSTAYYVTLDECRVVYNLIKTKTKKRHSPLRDLARRLLAPRRRIKHPKYEQTLRQLSKIAPVLLVVTGVAGIWAFQDRANQVPYHGPYQEPIK